MAEMLLVFSKMLLKLQLMQHKMVLHLEDLNMKMLMVMELSMMVIEQK
jgi:hypothetical protein